MKAEETLVRRKTDLILQQAAQERIDTKQEQEGVTEDQRKVLRFFLGKEQYAIDARYIESVNAGIQRELKIYPIPCVPNYLLGVINLRSEIISVLDLKVYFDLPTSEIDDETRIMVVKYEEISGLQLVVGLLVDKVEDIIDIPISSIQSALTTIEQVTADYMDGEAHYQDPNSAEETLIGIINLENILVSERSSRLGRDE